MIKLLELRNEKELSQRQMARELNISQGTYNNWENENTQPSIEQLIQLAKFFEVSVDFIVGNSEEYSAQYRPPLSKQEAQLLTHFNSLNGEQKDALLNLLEKMNSKA